MFPVCSLRRRWEHTGSQTKLLADFFERVTLRVSVQFHHRVLAVPRIGVLGVSGHMACRTALLSAPCFLSFGFAARLACYVIVEPVAYGIVSSGWAGHGPGPHLSALP